MSVQPLELASPEERREMIELKEKTMKFFKEMEENIRNKIRKAHLQDEKDRENRLRRGNSIEDEEDGFYYLDEREGSFDLQDPKEGGIANRNVRFSHASNADGTINSSRSVNSLETLAVKRVMRATSGSGDGNTPRLRENSFDVGAGHYDPKMTGRARKNSIGLGPPRRIRTISTMDGTYAVEFKFVSDVVCKNCLLYGESIFTFCAYRRTISICKHIPSFVG